MERKFTDYTKELLDEFQRISDAEKNTTSIEEKKFEYIPFPIQYKNMVYEWR